MSDNPAPEKKQDPIKVGDAVVRGPGGERMVVVRMNNGFIRCYWTDEHDRLRESVFAANELRRVE